MKTIPLANGQSVLIDDEDFERVSKFKWSFRKMGGISYAFRHWRELGVKKAESIHRHILNPKPGEIVDHINRNGLDNRRSNLRICNRSENCCNRKLGKNNKSGFKGVRLNKKTDKYEVRITKNGRVFFLGCFITSKEGAAAYNSAAKVLHGQFSRLNPV